ncbi:MAG: FKBP-type peptidyl-prolyl cis-trans isomerase [Bacteroidia bacterium]|nr:FKBP-type peptidyl-prolyl cis-trans isomerase [Bacteroidia bacterium]
MRSSKIILITFLLFAACLDVSNPEADQLTSEIKAINEYLAGVSFLEVTSGNNSGIQIGIKSFGSGAPPHNGQTVKVSFTGRLLSDWSIFETGTINDKLENIPINGLRYGIESIPEGTAATIFIVSTYAFGPSGTSTVPGNATIAYEVLLEEVIKTDLELTQFKKDTAAIHTYLNERSIAATKLSSGVWYTSDSAGTGASPNIYDLITFHYKGTILSSGIVFQEGDIPKQIIYGLIDGLKIGIPLINTGTTATYYIPSGLAYGPTANGLIPANANLIFEIKLNAIE